MLDSPAKRRKTSATTSNPADATLTARYESPTRDITAATPRHAAFLSPTKASSLRHHPSLLPKSPFETKSGGAYDVGSKLPPGGSYRDGTNGTGAMGEKPIRGLFGLNQRSRSPIREDEARALGFKPISGTGLSAAPRRSARFSGRFSSPTRQEPGPRASQNTQTRGTVLTRGENEEAHQDPEPDLPPTPTNRNDPAAVAPKGLLHTPSRRRLRKQSSRSISPEKQRTDARTENENHEDAQAQVGKPQVPIAGPLTRRRAAIKEQQAIDHSAIAEKSRLKARLSERVAKIQQDIQRCEEELAKTNEEQESSWDDTDPQHIKDYITLLLSSNPPDASDTTSVPPNPPSLALAVSSFLPFTKPPPVQINLPTPPSSSPARPIPSHRPIDLADPLPHLQAFTPLTFSCKTSFVPSFSTTSTSSSSSTSLLQQHIIDISSPAQLLTCTVVLIVDTTSQRITSLTTQSLSPWARPELQSFIQSREYGTTPAGKDISTLGWALGSYWTLAVQRAEAWAAAEKTYPEYVSTRIPLPVSSTASVDPAAPASPAADPVADPVADPGTVNDNESNPSPGPNQQPSASVPLRTLLTHLGRQALTLRKGQVEVLITWRIDLDWTGEAASSISATTRVPENWRETDSRSSLSKIDEVFDNLVREKGVGEAVRVVVGLLF